MRILAFVESGCIIESHTSALSMLRISGDLPFALNDIPLEKQSKTTRSFDIIWKLQLQVGLMN